MRLLLNNLNQLLYSLNQKLFSLRTQLFYPSLRVSYGINSHLTAQERLALYKLARGKREILEIGSYLGASATCFAAAVEEEESAKIYCIDTWNNDAMTEGKKDTYKIFHLNTRSFQHVIKPVRGFSTDVVDEIKAKTNTIDLLFIDGDHSYQGVKADWLAYKDFLQPSSIVVFHDIGWAEGVQKVIEEVKPYMKSFDCLPNLWWGEIGRKP
jgi:predicted O-methyltransferase YrrM